MLAHGGEVAADAREHLRARERAKRAGYLLLDLHHAQILFGLVVGERDRGIVQEGQHGALMLVEPAQEVVRFAVFGATAPPRPRRPGRVWIFDEACAQDGLIFSDPGASLRRGGRACAIVARGDGAVHAQEQIPHAWGPLLMQDLVEKREFTQQVGVAEAMRAWQAEIGLEAIVDEPAGKARKEREVFEGRVAAVTVDAIPGEASGADDMEPVERAGHAQAGFIGVGERRLGEQVSHRGLESGQRVGGSGGGGVNGRLADRPAEEVRAHLADARQREELLGAQIDQPGGEARAVLRGRGDVSGKGGRYLAARARATLDLHAVLGDDELLRGQIEDLSCLVAEYGLTAQRATAAAGAARQRMDDDAMGLLHGRQGVSGMPALAAAAASALCAQALGSGLGVAVG